MYIVRAPERRESPEFMQEATLKKINVIAVFAGFRTSRITRRITPLKIMLENGNTMEVANIQRTYTDRVGQAVHVHFVLKTTCGRYFDIVYDSQKMNWLMVVEIEDDMRFD